MNVDPEFANIVIGFVAFAGVAMLLVAIGLWTEECKIQRHELEELEYEQQQRERGEQ